MTSTAYADGALSSELQTAESTRYPAEYKAKARAADAQFVGGGSGRIPNAPKAMPEVKGIAFGALGEFSSSVNVLIDGFAHEGALKNPDRLGQNN